MTRSTAADYPVEIEVRDAVLHGDLAIPDPARGIVLFAHGSGSSRHSPRNRLVAEALQASGHATLLMDLLTKQEERVDNFTMSYRFDIDMLARRLVAAADWLGTSSNTSSLPVGLFGASTGAAAALIAAADRPSLIRAVVSRGGRPDLAGPALRLVAAPTLLIVGGDDASVIELNREALVRIPATRRLEIVPGASHLFEEPGTLEQVAKLAARWFDEYLK
jgi:pimeloyl-ACP methyl ester carboxylesterase